MQLCWVRPPPPPYQSVQHGHPPSVPSGRGPKPNPTGCLAAFLGRTQLPCGFWGTKIKKGDPHGGKSESTTAVLRPGPQTKTPSVRERRWFPLGDSSPPPWTGPPTKEGLYRPCRMGTVTRRAKHVSHKEQAKPRWEQSAECPPHPTPKRGKGPLVSPTLHSLEHSAPTQGNPLGQKEV